jgi:ligand-binding sensor domain-containing protein
MQRHIKLFSFLLIVLSINMLWGQKESAWRNFTDMKKINNAAILETGFFCGADGGAFYYSFVDSAYNTLGKPEGIFGSPVVSVAGDKYNKIWFGSNDGVIDIYNIAENSFKRILDIYNSGRTMKSINNILAIGDTIYVSTDFGLCLINPVNNYFYDSFLKFGNLSSNIPVNSCFQSDLLYVCLNQGIAKQKAKGLNLSSPESWTVFNTDSGLSSNLVYKIVKFRDTLIAATGNGLSFFDNNARWHPYLNSLNGKNILDIAASGDSLIILTDQTLSIYTGATQVIKQFSVNATASKIAFKKPGELFIASQNGLYSVTGANAGKYFYPNGPEVNFSSDMSVDSKGNLWVASGSDRSGKGFFKYDGLTWTNFNTATYPILPFDAYFRVLTGTDGNVYFGNWGRGFAKISDNDQITVFTSENTPLIGVSGHPETIVITGLKNDSKNNLWVLNYNPSDYNFLNLLTKDSTWYQYKNTFGNYFNTYTALLVDQYDTKWFVADNPASTLFYFNENGTLNNLSDDKWGTISSGDGLLSYAIKCLALDRRGDIWVGTTLGANIITNTNQIMSNKSPKVLSVYSLRQQGVNCIAVDPLNQKWVGTNQGLMLVSSDGTSLLKVYTTKNSNLLSDIIKAVTFDDNTGTVYVGTDYGISSFKTSYVKPVDSFSGLNVYPNPLVIDGSNKVITIDGLIKESGMRILSLSGQLIKEIETPGGKIAYWDGRDKDGKYVGSGVYFIIAYDKEGSSVAKAKVAVIRKI